MSQQHPTWRNISQQGGQTHATCSPNGVAICCVECCDRLAGASSPGQTIAKFQHNISQHCKPSICKLRPNDRNIVWRNILHAFGHPVSTCCDMLRVEIKLVPMPKPTLLHEPDQTTTTSCIIHKCCMKNLTIFKFEPTTPNIVQHFATCRTPDSVAISCVEML